MPPAPSKNAGMVHSSGRCNSSSH